jgi:hypothetical protein
MDGLMTEPPLRRISGNIGRTPPARAGYSLPAPSASARPSRIDRSPRRPEANPTSGESSPRNRPPNRTEPGVPPTASFPKPFGDSTGRGEKTAGIFQGRFPDRSTTSSGVHGTDLRHRCQKRRVRNRGRLSRRGGSKRNSSPDGRGVESRLGPVMDAFFHQVAKSERRHAVHAGLP